MAISRRDFLRDALGTAAAAGLSSAAPASITDTESSEDSYFGRLVQLNDAALPATLARLQGPALSSDPRGLARMLGVLVAAYCAPQSSHYRSDALPHAMDQTADRLLGLQHPDGTIDSGNYNSPPDTGFVVQALCTAATVLKRANSAELASTNGKLDRFLLAAGGALVTGGVHTPNHRWVISSALAQLNALYPKPEYVHRIDDWLGEGIYCDIDGQYSERSTGIYSGVINRALITLARLLDRPELLEPVRRNLTMTMFFMHPNGELETVGSRRQDQLMSAWISNYRLEYRYMANHDRNRQFAGVSRLIEQLDQGHVAHAEFGPSLIDFLEEPLYRKALPEPEAVPSAYHRVFTNSGLARVRRDKASATIYGGSDWPLGVESGLASNPTFFNYRKGSAVLESVRMVADFFSEGPFRSAGLTLQDGSYRLEQQLSVPYYQPLPKHLRNARGDYALTSAGGRYWSKMNFPGRPHSNVQVLNQVVTVRDTGSAFELTFDVSGHDRVPVTIELAFRKGGTLQGTEHGETATELYFLRKGDGRYRVGDDTITFGPGQADHENVPVAKAYYNPYIETSDPEHHRVYLTGYTPFRKTLTIG